MSVLLVRPPGQLGPAVIDRLLSQGDVVRVIEGDASAAARWKRLGAFVARGSEGDSDLVERAAQDVRTVVVFEDAQASIEAILEGAELAGVGRLVLCTPKPSEPALGLVRTSRLDYVVLRTARPGPWRRAQQPGSTAEAIDAADDLGGHPRLEVDLRDARGRRKLGI